MVFDSGMDRGMRGVWVKGTHFITWERYPMTYTCAGHQGIHRRL
jgi:hypothetical protein